MLKGNYRTAFAVLASILMLSSPVAGAVSVSSSELASDEPSTLDTTLDASQTEATVGIDAQILNINQESGQHEPGERVTADVEIRNTGDNEHAFFVGYSVRGPNGNWYDNNEQTGKTVTLGPNEREWITVSWTVEDEANTGDYDSDVSVWAESDRDNLETRLDREQRDNAFEVIEPTEIDAEISDFHVDAGEYETGESVDSTATIKNTGDTEHTFFVGYSAIGPYGEAFDNGDETGRSVTLDPGEQRSVSLDWSVESDAPMGDYDARVSVWEESDRDDLQTRLDDSHRSSAFEVVEPEEIDARTTEFDVDSGEFKQGESVGANVVVKNTGNTEHTFYVGYSTTTEGEGYFDNGGETGQAVTLDAGEQRSLFLDWQVESDAPPGSYDARASIWKEGDRDNLQTRLDDSHRGNAFEVVEDTEIDATVVDFDTETGDFGEGDTVSATAMVENTGNTEHTFFVGYSVFGPDGTPYDNNEETGRAITLSPGERRSVNLQWSVESDAPKGEYAVRTSIWKESDRDALETRLDYSQYDDAFSVVRPSEVEASIIDFAVEKGEFRLGDHVEAAVIVENTGNTQHTFFVGFSTTTQGDGYYDNEGESGETVILEPGERRSVSLSWTVEDNASEGDYDARASIWKENDRDDLQTRLDDLVREDAFEVIADTEIEAEIAALEIDSGEFEEGDSVSATAMVENTGNTEHTFFVGYSVFGPDGTPYDNNEETGKAVTLEPGNKRAVTLEWTVEAGIPPGIYSTRVSVWKESDSTSLQTRLDTAETQDAFSIPGDSVQPEIERLESDLEPYYGVSQNPAVSVTVTNTAPSAQTLTIDPKIAADGALAEAGQTRELGFDPGETRTIDLTWDLDNEFIGQSTELIVSTGTASSQESKSHSVGQTVVVEELVETTITVSHWETGEAITDATVRGELQTSLNDQLIGLDQDSMTAEHLGDGKYTFGKLPKGAGLEVVAQKDEFATIDWRIVIGDEGPITGQTSFYLQPLVDPSIEFVRESNGEPISGLPVTVDGRTYDTNELGIVRLPEAPAGGVISLTVNGYENDKPYRFTRDVTIPGDGRTTVRASKLTEVSEQSRPSSMPQDEAINLAREFITGSTPEISTEEAIRKSLSRLSENDESGNKLLFVRSREGLVAVYADLNAWQETQSDSAYETLPIGEELKTTGPARPIVMTEQMEQEAVAGASYAIMGAGEGLGTGLSGTDETYDYLGSSQGVYLDRDSTAYGVGHFLGKMLTESIGMTARGVAEGEAGKAGLGVTFLAIDLAGGKLIKAGGKSLFAGAKTVKNSKVYKWSDGVVGMAKPTAAQLNSFAAYSGTAREKILSRSPQYLGRVLRSTDGESKSLTTHEKFDIIDDYYANKGSGVTADAAQKARDWGVDRSTIVEASEEGVDLRYAAKLKHKFDRVDESVVKALLQQRVALSKVMILLDETAMTPEDVVEVASKIDDSKSAFKRVNWREFFEHAYELRTVENFDHFIKTGDSSVMHEIETALSRSEIKGVLNEMETAAGIGADKIAALGTDFKIPESQISSKVSDDLAEGGIDREIDIIRSDGTLIEVKSTPASKKTRKLVEQIEAYQEYSRQTAGLSPQKVEVQIRKVKPGQEKKLAEIKSQLPDEVRVRRLDDASASSISKRLSSIDKTIGEDQPKPSSKLPMQSNAQSELSVPTSTPEKTKGGV